MIDFIKKEVKNTLNQQTIDKGIDPNAPYADWFNLDSNHSGKCGEKVIKKVFSVNSVNIEGDEDKVIHTDYDVKAWLSNGPEKKYEVKTARLDSKKHFQFDGITPTNQFDYIVLLAVTPDKIYLNIHPKTFIYQSVDNTKGTYAGKMRWCMYGKMLAPMHRGTLDGGLKLTLPSKTLQSKFGFVEVTDDGQAVKTILDTLK